MKQLKNLNNLKMMEIISRIPFFKVLTPEDRKQFIRKEICFFAFEKGEFIIQEGAEDNHFFILLSGSAKVYRGLKDIEFLAHLSPGEFVGEVAFITNQARTASVVALEECIMLRIDRGGLQRIPPAIRDRIKDRIISGLTQRVQRLNNEMLETRHENETMQQQLYDAENSNQAYKATQIENEKREHERLNPKKEVTKKVLYQYKNE